MNNIGVGIFCFGQDFYFRGTVEKLKYLLGEGFHCYILTDKPEYFREKYAPNVLHTIEYQKSYHSYHDKMILPKHVLKYHDYCVLIDADIHITDYSFMTKLLKYQIKYGISYVDTLLNHPAKKEFVKELLTDNIEWDPYKNYAEKLVPSFGEFETIWEYLLIINKIGFNQKKFYDYYERLQVAKDFCDLSLGKEVSGAGEGVSIAIASKLSATDLQRDMELYEDVKDTIKSVSRRFTRPEFWPDWMR